MLKSVNLVHLRKHVYLCCQNCQGYTEADRFYLPYIVLNDFPKMCCTSQYLQYL